MSMIKFKDVSYDEFCDLVKFLIDVDDDSSKMAEYLTRFIPGMNIEQKLILSNIANDILDGEDKKDSLEFFNESYDLDFDPDGKQPPDGIDSKELLLKSMDKFFEMSKNRADHGFGNAIDRQTLDAVSLKPLFSIKKSKNYTVKKYQAFKAIKDSDTQEYINDIETNLQKLGLSMSFVDRLMTYMLHNYNSDTFLMILSLRLDIAANTDYSSEIQQAFLTNLKKL